ncbi:type II toxin-antitoxin system PemK/MazF family toxin [Lapillicoccus jejuensis]|uniref:PemK-like, MazF-like toxin of type II toxin-antitoxin system n=1 Tax=Lapillicoccus jejuensis TaxID=402171 RepID=A0A542E698_9MICO|nr:type II toxin-antitoxin system PemK/MazF family toxin [Lapillicoccus jejuensis]TQJ10860.1 PemK-like, MazF-like toxin of type II toxin-antitoxin system [Lapillicoccus jejuensis]
MPSGLVRRLRRALSAVGVRPPRPREQHEARPPAPAPTGARNGARPTTGTGGPPPAGMRPYPGDYPGAPPMHWAPRPDGRPDPGEVVWTWVPFEEDASVGKDRPVLLVGHDGDWLLGVMLTSRDHDAERGGRAREHAAGREWVDVGAGPWDPRGRPSEVRTDRVIRVDPGAVRREGAVLPREVFDVVAAAVRRTT